MARFHWATADDAGLTLTVNRLWHITGSPGPAPFQDPQARLWEGRTLLDLTWRSGRAGGPGALLRLYGLDDDVSFASPGSAFQSEDAAHLWGAQAQVVLAPWPGHLLTLGAEYQGQTIGHIDNSPTTFGNRGYDLGLYVQDDWQLTPRMLLSTGIRQDTFELYGSQVNPRIGVVVVLTDRWVLRAGAGRTFRAPSFDELAPAFFGNPNLQPESAWSYDLGLEYAVGPGLTLRLTGYYKDATNLITSSPPLFVPMNVGHALVSGGSAELGGLLSDRGFVRANITEQAARDAAYGLGVDCVPRTLGDLELKYEVDPGTTGNVILSYGGDRVANAPGARSICDALQVAMPGSPADAKGLLRWAALRSQSPTVFMSHQQLFPLTGEVPDGEYEVPFGQADIKRSGSDVTIVACGVQVHRALQVAERLAAEGVDCEVVDPRTLAPLDLGAILGSVRKTGRVVVTDESHDLCGVAAGLAALIADEAFKIHHEIESGERPVVGVNRFVSEEPPPEIATYELDAEGRDLQLTLRLA